MRYVVDLEDGTIWPHGVGVKLDEAAARQVAQTIAEHFNVAEGIPLQDPPEPAYRPYTSNPWEQPSHTGDEGHDDLSDPAMPA